MVVWSLTSVCTNEPDYPAEFATDSAHHLPATYQIFAEIFTGKTVTLHVEDSDTIDDVRVQVCDKTSIPPRFVCLMLDGKVLRVGSFTLGKAGVVRESTLRLVSG